MIVFLLPFSQAVHAGQAARSLESVRAAQNALRSADGTVAVTIDTGGAVPIELTDRARAMLLHPSESLTIRNASGSGIWLRFADDNGAPLLNETIVVADGETRTLSPAALSRLAGPDRFLNVSIADPTPESVPEGALWFVILEGPPAAQERASDLQVSVAQAALPRTPVTKAQADAAQPPLAPETSIDVGPPQPDPAIAKESRPLPIERIRQDGRLIGDNLRLTTSTGPRLATFRRGDGTVVTRAVSAPSPQNPGALITYQEITDWAGRDGNLSFTVGTGGAVDYTGYLTVNVSPLETGHLVVPVDLTGVSDWRFLNPRTPARIGPVRAGTTPATLEFVNRVPGRTIKVAFPAFTSTPDLEARFRTEGFELDCSRPTTCTPELVLQAANRRVPGRLLVDAYGGLAKEGLVEFKVSFFEGDVEPANSSGYLAVVPRPFEPSFSVAWNAAANAGFLHDAQFAGFTMNENEAPVINTATPFDGQARWHMTGTVRLSARPQMGTRANAEVDLIVKDKDFGIADAPIITTQKARVNVFGYNGFSLSLGRYDFAAPTRAIAISESGEGLSGRWRRYTVSHVVRPRERLDRGAIFVPEGQPAVFPASPDLRDRWSTLAQGQWAPSWMRIEVSALTGRRKTLKRAEGLYFTWGGDLMAANGFGREKPKETELTNETAAGEESTESAESSRPGVVWRLNGGFYSSYREARASAIDANGADRGWSGLIDGTVAWLNGRTPRLTIGATMAIASRDDTTTSENEGYTGESAAFVPDKIFLATLAGKVALLTHTDADGETQSRPLSGGLTGKKYLGAGFVYQGFSPLEWLARAFAVPRSDMSTSSVTFRWHGYSLRNPISTNAAGSARSWLGQETSIEWLLESPRGVRYTLTGAYFVPGELLKAQKLILSSTWYVDARVTVTLR